MKRAHALEIHVERMASRMNMTYLGMHEAVNRRTVHHHAAADPRADGQIHEVFDVSSGPPAMFGQSRRVDVGVETDGTLKFPRECARDVGSAPAGLRSPPDEAIVGRVPVEFHGPERCEADGRECAE
jgi:hypothetical protein